MFDQAEYDRAVAWRAEQALIAAKRAAIHASLLASDPLPAARVHADWSALLPPFDDVRGDPYAGLA